MNTRPAPNYSQEPSPELYGLAATHGLTLTPPEADAVHGLVFGLPIRTPEEVKTRQDVMLLPYRDANASEQRAHELRHLLEVARSTIR